jgi:spoIIIJ-associated protein
MSGKRASLEVIAPSIEEAIERGLADLGLPEDAVEIEVLDEGSRGLFGLGSRQSRVRLTIKSAPKGEAVEQEEVSQSVDQTDAVVEDSAPEVEEAGVEIADEIAAESISDEDADIEAGEFDEQSDLILDVACETVEELLETMEVQATVTARYLEPDDAHSRSALLVDVRGNDLSILIGPRGETLNALQYIAHLIVGKELGRSVPLVVDVEGYRERRSEQIRRLARRMAEQAVRSGRRQTLEPMPASERRLVHIELRKNPDVTTESVGEDPRRKVMIIPR